MLTRRAFAAGAAAAAAGALNLSARTEQAAGRTGMPDVLVIGAGLSGLESALLLQEQGANVQVIEGRARIGGRVYTLFDRPGYPEVGGNGFAKGYGRVLNRARSLKLTLVDNTPRRMKDPKYELALDASIIRRDQWELAARNPFPAENRARMPWEFSGAFVTANNPIKSVGAWLDDDNASLDVSLRDWLVDRGLDDRTINLCWTTNPYFGTSAFDVSALQCLNNDVWTRAIGQGSPASYGVLGGNQQLPMTMARQLKNEVHLRREVVAVKEQSDHVEVICRDGSRYKAKAVVCSVPFSVLRNVHFDPSLAGAVGVGVNSLPYMINTLIFFVPKRRFWEDDGLSPNMWTDGPAGAVTIQRFGKDENEVTAVVANARGNMAAWLDRLPPQEAIAAVRQAIEALRPAARGALEAGFIHSWARDPFAGGDWAVFAPGQVRRFGKLMASPQGRVYFCGEHTARANRGMEGALESAERVALELADRL